MKYSIIHFPPNFLENSCRC